MNVGVVGVDAGFAADLRGQGVTVIGGSGISPMVDVARLMRSARCDLIVASAATCDWGGVAQWVADQSIPVCVVRQGETAREVLDRHFGGEHDTFTPTRTSTPPPPPPPPRKI